MSRVPLISRSNDQRNIGKGRFAFRKAEERRTGFAYVGSEERREEGGGRERGEKGGSGGGGGGGCRQPPRQRHRR
ncbi:hypothetical protein V1477_002621 [Vespula maculifrons]|uniref:Uncharacterized protein n=1 Tax=Vespula maculifrons TaxID=7453 RepID=A0ABD2CVG6_VESMC